ncbi:MAG: IS66 family insertion sequence element accessory protein TnpB [Gammaproteobacteria bacterium]|nr:IS66 family insertion sequence element accessory protein TnpB [Gammaproteobacteria bacterium]MDH5799645.1 IS66 family insertion sequence element accessory protein TnpB [Gammaproteobacteria bacterium]
MMRFVEELPVYLHREPVDFRKAINGLSVIVQESMQLDPFGCACYVFTNRYRNRLKILYWDKNGFCLWLKRLEKDKFAWPRTRNEDCVILSIKELHWLLEGFDIWRQPPHQRLYFDSVI